jgi:nitrite reductase (NADH) small subunit
MTLTDPASYAPSTTDFTAVCDLDRLTPDRGVAAMVDGVAVAVFHLAGGELAVVDNVEPISGASVVSRGLVGEVDGSPTVASPLYKQRFDLRTGVCLDDPTAAIGVHHVRTVEGRVEVRLAASGDRAPTDVGPPA